MRLFKIVEAESGILHFVIANNNDEAKELALTHANLMRGEDEAVIPEEMKQVEIGQKEELTFFSDSNPISHTKKDWETVYEPFKEPFYLACSIY